MSPRFCVAVTVSALLSVISMFAMAQESGSNQNLEEVIVLGQKQPYRGDVPLESLPQQVQIISSDMLGQLGEVEFQGALDMAGGVARQNSFGGLWDSFAIRGFPAVPTAPVALPLADPERALPDRLGPLHEDRRRRQPRP